MANAFQKKVDERRAAEADTREDPRRAAPKEMTPRERAAARAAQLREHMGGIDEGTDEFYIPPSIIPDGWTYEWKRHKMFNQEDPAYITQLAREGWEAVPLDRDKDHRAMMPRDWHGNIIERKGMVLMERPEEITQEVRRIELTRARQQVRVKEAQLSGAPEGTFSRDNPQVAPKIKKSFDMPIPEDL